MAGFRAQLRRQHLDARGQVLADAGAELGLRLVAPAFGKVEEGRRRRLDVPDGVCLQQPVEPGAVGCDRHEARVGDLPDLRPAHEPLRLVARRLGVVDPGGDDGEHRRDVVEPQGRVDKPVEALVGVIEGEQDGLFGKRLCAPRGRQDVRRAHEGESVRAEVLDLVDEVLLRDVVLLDGGLGDVVIAQRDEALRRSELATRHQSAPTRRQQQFQDAPLPWTLDPGPFY